MRKLLIKTAAMATAALLLSGGSALAGKDNDTLTWSTDREADVALPYWDLGEGDTPAQAV